jgi:AraC-like DNA-binding protein
VSREALESPQTRRLLFESKDVSAFDFRCRAHVEPEGPEEPNASHSIVLVRRGVFRLTRRRDTIVADPNHVLFFNAAEPCRYGHPVPGGDDCTILAVETSRALEIVARYAPGDAEDPWTPFRRDHALSGPRVAWLHYELLQRLRRRDEGLSLEDLLWEIADESVRALYREHASRACRKTLSGSARRRRRELVEAAKLALNESLETPPSLGELAALCGCSPFHLSRAFHETAGLSLRRYTGRLRARVAAERLAAGARDLTSLGLDLGYADHSHFTNSFRREWGVPPSRFRALLGSVPSRSNRAPNRAPNATLPRPPRRNDT